LKVISQSVANGIRRVMIAEVPILGEPVHLTSEIFLFPIFLTG
jgi:hypothetical protein